MQLFRSLPGSFWNLYPTNIPTDKFFLTFLMDYCRGGDILELAKITTGRFLKTDQEVPLFSLEGSGTVKFMRSTESTCEAFYSCVDNQEREVKVKITAILVEKGRFFGKKDKWLVDSICYYKKAVDDSKTEYEEGRVYVHEIFPDDSKVSLKT